MYEHEQRDRCGRRRAAVSVLAVLLLFVVAFERPSSQTMASATSGLAGIFAAGGALQDTNGDGAVDFIAAQIIVAPDAPAADVAAAANIAARFGFETMAMDLPVAARASEAAPAGTRLVVLVGSGNPAVSRLAQAGTVDLAALRPGQGVVAYVGAADSGVGVDAVVVAGADEAGTIAGSEAVAARAPYLWALGGPTFKDLEDDLRAFLAKSDAAPDSVLVASATVERNRHEWLSLTVRAAFSTATRVAAARTALQGLAAAHVAGREGQVLSYPGVGTVDVRLAAPGIAGSRVRVIRVGAGVETPLPRRAGAGGGRSADLSNLYATGGLLGDSQNDLIPDRTDTVIIPAGAEEALGAIDLAARLGLESTGIRVPLAKAPADVQDPAGESNPILIGRTNPLVQRLVADKKLDAGELQPGQGLLRIVPRAFGSSGALVVTGGDARGVARATSQLAERLRAGPAWQGDQWGGLVFANEIGGPLSGSWVTHHFQALVKLAGLPPMRYHDLRHGAASIMAALGVPVIAIHGPTDPRRWGPLVYSYRSASAMGTLAACRDGMYVMSREATKARPEMVRIWSHGMA